MGNKKKLTAEQHEKLLDVLKSRFEKNMHRHKSIKWEKVQERLISNPEKIWSLHEMKETGGEPDVISHDKNTGEFFLRLFSRKLAEVFVMILKL